MPFVARYRKEVTDGLDDTQLRKLERERGWPIVASWRPAAQRVLAAIEGQGKLTPELSEKIVAAVTKAEIEDLYAPFKPKRRTKGEIAKEKGLEPLADALFLDRTLEPATAAVAYVNDAVPDIKAALDGARDILAERFAETPELVGRLRTYMRDRAVLRSAVIAGKEVAGEKFADYFDHRERWATVPEPQGARHAARP